MLLQTGLLVVYTICLLLLGQRCTSINVYFCPDDFHIFLETFGSSSSRKSILFWRKIHISYREVAKMKGEIREKLDKLNCIIAGALLHNKRVK